MLTNGLAINDTDLIREVSQGLEHRRPPSRESKLSRWKSVRKATWMGRVTAIEVNRREARVLACLLSTRRTRISGDGDGKGVSFSECPIHLEARFTVKAWWCSPQRTVEGGGEMCPFPGFS